MSAQQKDFRKWIEAGFKNYGKDPWFFIRELAQNSRDAKASEIHVKIGYTAKKEEVLVFEDNGQGMTYSHAKNYLFRLYASSKTNDKTSAGMFGIGFWTVLKFNPTSILIESCTGKGSRAKAWGIGVDVGKDLETRSVPGTLVSHGTRITLIRNPQESSEKAFFKATHAALERYCRYLRRNNRKADPLPLYFGGRNLTTDITIPGAVSYQFKDNLVEGAVGLAPRPQVKLFSRGLPVWEGTTLDELSHTPPEHQKLQEFGQGLAPVFLLNGNRLDVNISRRKVIDNRNLQHVRKTAEKALSNMIETAADTISPRKPMSKLKDKLKHRSLFTFSSFFKMLVLLVMVLVPLEIFLLKTFYKGPAPKVPLLSSPRTAITLKAEGDYYSGASVDQITPEVNSGFSYSPPQDRWFRLFYADKYDPLSGFRQSSPPESALQESPIPAPHLFQCLEGQEIDICLEIQAPGPIFLPQPLFYALLPHTITLNNQPISFAALQYRFNGEVILNVAQKGAVRYRCCLRKSVADTQLSPELTQQFLHLPEELKLPATIERILTDAQTGNLEQKVQTALTITSSILTYDDSSRTARMYAAANQAKGWFQRVRQIGVGDCDIINGVNTLFLRHMGVPARLAIGAIGREGEILPVLHAWTEYYDINGERYLIDASAHVSHSRPHHTARPNTPAPLSPGQNSQSNKSHNLHPGTSEQLLYILAAILVVLTVPFVTLLLARKPKQSGPVSAPQRRQIEKDIAGMALYALLHSNHGVWGQNSGIRDFNLIPTLGKKNGSESISINDALKLGKERKLFTATAENPIVTYLESARPRTPVPILDGGNKAFEPLIKLLPGALHLEEIIALKVIPPEKAPHSWIGQLVKSVNHMFSELKIKNLPHCLLASGHMSGDILDVDLSAFPPLPEWLVPNRFIAISPYSRRINAIAALYKENAPLAQYRFIDMILKESSIVPTPVSPILQTVSRHLLRNRKQAGESES